MKRYVTVLLGLVAAAAMGGARAEPIPGTRTNVAGWTLDAHADSSGSFTHCALSANYRSGIAMIFSIERDFRWRVGWSSANWKFQAGQKVEVSLYIDGQGPYPVVATALNADFAAADLPDSLELFDRFRKGSQLTVVAQSNRYAFNLEGTYAALTEAHACVKRYVASAPAKAPPPLIASPPPKPQPAKPSAEQLAVERRLEATTFAANLLAQGDLSGFRILSGKEREDPGLKTFAVWDVLWVGDDVLGALRIAPSAISTSHLASWVMTQDSLLCRDGQFASGTSVDDKSTNLTRLFTSCRADRKEWTARYLMIPREEGGFYLLGTFASEKDKPAGDKIEDVDGLLRASVFNVLKKR